MEAWQATVQDEFGNAVFSPQITVYESDGVTLASIFNEDGSPKENPFTGTLEGFAQFWAGPGVYKIRGANGGQTELWESDLGGLGVAESVKLPPYTPFDSRAQAASAPIPASVQQINIKGVQYVRDPDGTALETADGAMWSPLPDNGGMVPLAAWGVVYGDRSAATENTARINEADAWAADKGYDLYLGEGTLFFDDTLYHDADWIGAGRGIWYPHPPAIKPAIMHPIAPAPTQLVAVGTFPRTYTLYGVSSMRAGGAVHANGSAVGGDVNDEEYSMLSFMDPDTGTAKPFSIAVLKRNNEVRSEGFRVIPDFGGDYGVDGYEDPNESRRSYADVDVGLYIDAATHCAHDNLDIVGHWRMAGCFVGCIKMDILDTAGYTYYCSFRECSFQGYAGWSMRGSDCYRILEVGSDYVEVPWADDLALRDPSVWPRTRLRYRPGNYLVRWFGQDITSVTQVGNRARIQFAGAIEDVEVGHQVVPASFGGANSHVHLYDCQLSGFHFSNGAAACDGGRVDEPFPHPSRCFEISGFRSVETIIERPLIQTTEEVAFHIHEHRFLKINDMQIEPENPGGVREMRAIAGTADPDGAGQAVDIQIGGHVFTAQNYLDLRPAAAIGGERYPGDGGLLRGTRTTVPGYHGSVNSQGPFMRPSVGGLVGIKGSGSGLDSPNIFVYSDNNNRIVSNAPIHDRSGVFISRIEQATSVEYHSAHDASVVIEDDTAAEIILSSNVFNGMAFIAGNGIASVSGIMAFRSWTSSNFAFKVGGQDRLTAADGDTILTGTTGSDGDLTFSAATGRLYLENRTGQSRRYRIRLML